MTDISTSLLTSLIAGLSRTLEDPSDQFPSTRCAQRGPLVSLLLELRGRHADVTEFRQSGRVMLDALRSAGVIRPIPVDVESPRWGPDRLWSVGIGVTPDEITPPELLQTIEPRGVLCYQSAIEVHRLSTQLPGHHHVARVRTPALARPARTSPHAVTAPPPIGRPLFRWRGDRYHLTTRDPRYLAAVESARVQQFAIFRVTTLEQTLVDTMHRPGHCGGLDVVFECWQAAAERLNADAIMGLVRRIGDDVLARRVGWMMASFGIGLAETVRELASNAAPEAQAEIPALFAGMPYTSVDRLWRLRVP